MTFKNSVESLNNRLDQAQESISELEYSSFEITQSHTWTNTDMHRHTQKRTKKTYKTCEISLSTGVQEGKEVKRHRIPSQWNNT